MDALLILLVRKEDFNPLPKQAVSVKVGTHREGRSQQSNRVQPMTSYGLNNGIHHIDEGEGCVLLDALKGNMKGVTGQDAKVRPCPMQTIQSLDCLPGYFIPLFGFEKIDESLKADTVYDDLRKSVVMKPFVIGSDHVLVVDDGRLWSRTPQNPDSFHPSILSCFVPHRKNHGLDRSVSSFIPRVGQEDGIILEPFTRSPFKGCHKIMDGE